MQNRKFLFSNKNFAIFGKKLNASQTFWSFDTWNQLQFHKLTDWIRRKMHPKKGNF